MILTRTPFRIPLGGGGTDLPAFYKKHGGFLFSAAIDKFMYVGLNRSSVEDVIRITHSDAEIANSLEEIKHELAREALKYFHVPVKGLEVVSFADLPPGSGMGSSGSYIVGLLKALHQLQNKNISPQALAEMAFHIEINILNKPVGKQDQYLAAFGGFVEMYIDLSGKVEVKKPDFTQDLIDELKTKAILFYTHKKHDTVDILKDQSEQAAIPESQTEKAMLRIKEIGLELKSEMEKASLKNFGKLMNEHWQVKKNISGKMSDSRLDAMYDLAMQNGAEGGKIMGSGGGGLFFFFVPNKQGEFRKTLSEAGLTELKYDFEMQGASVIYNQ
jgi:D-glycero-alpha-D-manno-heptose-7-phosphate kinase